MTTQTHTRAATPAIPQESPLRDVPADLDALVVESHAAALLAVSPRALQAWRQRGGGPQFVRISARCIRYRHRDLVAWAEARLRSSTSAQPHRSENTVSQ